MRTLIWLFAPAVLFAQVLFAQVNVPYERIRDADKEPGNWLMYSIMITPVSTATPNNASVPIPEETLKCVPVK